MPIPFRFLGYGARRTEVPAGWQALEPAGVTSICSVASCTATRPSDWIDRWDFNRACCYDSEALALAAAGGGPGFRVLAYLLIAARLDERGQEIAVDVDALFSRELPALPLLPLAAGFVPLGYDVVSMEAYTGPESASPVMTDFDHSPLSCCSLAGEVPVNPYCLIEDLPAALRVASQWDRGGAEPGPYFVVQVWGRP